MRIRLLAVCMIVGAACAAVAEAGYYPERPVYDYRETVHNGDCGDAANDHNRCGPTDGPVFNSFINTPSYGDERAFLDARIDRQQERYDNQDVVDVSGNARRRVIIRAYVNNDANEYYGAKTTATGTRIAVALPSGTAKALRARAVVSAENATPGEVSDTVDLVARNRFRIRYVPGSAVLLRDNTSRPIADSIVDDGGASLSSDGQPGHFKAGFDRAALIEFAVDVEPRTRLWAWLAGATLALFVVGFGLFGAGRRMAAAGATWLWRQVTGEDLWLQVLAGLIAAAIVGALGIVLAVLWGAAA